MRNNVPKPKEIDDSDSFDMVSISDEGVGTKFCYMNELEV